MPSSVIELNGVAASNFDVTINTTINLTNADTGGELTYLWEIVDQPDGTADTIANPTLEAASILVRKEGSYLIRLTVNQGSPGIERIDHKVIAIRYLKTGDRFPAANETTQGGADGWKDEQTGLNNAVRRHADAVADPLVVTAVVKTAGLAAGALVQFTSSEVIKAGLVGQESIPGCVSALANATILGQVGSIVGPARPGASITAIGSVVRVRIGGLVQVSAAGAPTVGDPVYVSNAGAPALTPGATSRQVGRVVSVGGGSYFWYMDVVQAAAQLGLGSGWPSTLFYSPFMGGGLASRGIVNDEARAYYMGRAKGALSSIKVRWNQTALGTITWAEMGIATGAFVPGSAPTLTIRGFVNAAAEWGATGVKQLTVPISGTPIAPDEEIWSVYGVNASAGAPTIQVSSNVDPLAALDAVKRTACRPSLNLNTPLAFVADNATAPYIAFAL